MDNPFRNPGTATHHPTLDVLALTALRIVVGIIAVAHGYQKLTDPGSTQEAFAGMGVPLPSLAAWLAIAGEFFGGLGILLGALTPIASFGFACVMLAAITWVHAGQGFFAAEGGYEFPLLLLVTAVFFLVRGPGPWSIDALVQRARRSEPDAPGLRRRPS